MTYSAGDQITWQALPEGSVRTGIVAETCEQDGKVIGYYVAADDRRSTGGLGSPGYPVLVSPRQVVEPMPEWDEGITLVPQQFTRRREVVQYAADHTGGDIAAAIIDLVNTGLSYQ